jgi:hypothetical protein
VKRSGDKWRLRDHVAFFSYRWLAWAVAALTLTLPGHTGATLPRDAGLLLLLGVITVTATALAQSYVRLLRQRPGLLALDLAASAAILWLSGSAPLPFFPYALGALLLPALAFGWRGAVLGAAAFSALDTFGLTVVNPAMGESLGPVALGARLLTPFAFAFAWAIAGRLLPRDADGAAQRSAPGGLGALSAPPQSQRLDARPGAPLRLTNLPRPDAPPATTPGNLAATTPLLIARTAAETQPKRASGVLFDAPATPAVSLPDALERLAAAAARQSGVAVAASCQGEARPLNAAQQTVLLRAAQEALLNVQQHARAHSATLTLRFEPGAVTLSVADDGVGLLDGTYERPGLHALRAVRYRLAELDGQLDVFEPEDGGLTVRATLPIEEPPE